MVSGKLTGSYGVSKWLIFKPSGKVSVILAVVISWLVILLNPKKLTGLEGSTSCGIWCESA